MIKVLVNNKDYINGSWTVDLGVNIKSFIWWCPPVPNLAHGCSGIYYTDRKQFMSDSSSGQLYNLEYTISGTKVTFPEQPVHTFKNGATVYFVVDTESASASMPLSSSLIPITVSGKNGLSAAWTVDLGISVKSFMWYCPGVGGLAYPCSGICYGNIKECHSNNGSSAEIFSLNYTISGTKVTFPAQSSLTFTNGAIVYFMVGS